MALAGVQRPLPRVLRGPAALLQACGCQADRRRLDVAGCSRCLSLRPGEASKPGPRKVRKPREGLLEEVSLLQPATVKLRAKHWAAFDEWLLKSLGPRAREEVFSCPVLLVEALRGYGQVLFAAGVPLHYYRQILAHAQLEFPGTRPLMFTAWRLVTKWELVEPIQHRPPIPEPLVKAMASLALGLGWARWSALVMVCFSGACRIGEPLRALRRDLLLPNDLLSERC